MAPNFFPRKSWRREHTWAQFCLSSDIRRIFFQISHNYTPQISSAKRGWDEVDIGKNQPHCIYRKLDMKQYRSLLWENPHRLRPSWAGRPSWRENPRRICVLHTVCQTWYTYIMVFVKNYPCIKWVTLNQSFWRFRLKMYKMSESLTESASAPHLNHLHTKEPGC